MITCEKFTKKESGALIGFADLMLSSGMLIRSCSVFQKEGRMWISFPSRQYEDDSGEKKYYNYIVIPDSEKYKQFMQGAVTAVKEKMADIGPVAEHFEAPTLKSQQATVEQKPAWTQPQQEVLPF